MPLAKDCQLLLWEFYSFPCLKCQVLSVFVEPFGFECVPLNLSFIFDGLIVYNLQKSMLNSKLLISVIKFCLLQQLPKQN